MTPGQDVGSPEARNPGNDNNGPARVMDSPNGGGGSYGYQRPTQDEPFGASMGELGDRNMAGRVRRTVFANPELFRACRGVSISVFNGDVTLQGQVASGRDRDLLVKRVGDVVGPDRVDNQVEVR